MPKGGLPWAFVIVLPSGLILFSFMLSASVHGRASLVISGFVPVVFGFFPELVPCLLIPCAAIHELLEELAVDSIGIRAW